MNTLMILHIIRSWTRPHWQWTPPPPHTLIGASGLGLRAESCFSLISKFVCLYLICISLVFCAWCLCFIGAYMCPIPAGEEIAKV